MERLPIVFIHAGDQHWVGKSIAQACAANPGSPVVLISQHCPALPAGAEFRYIGDYFAQASTLKATYEHFSQYDPAYELFCFQRWFVLRDFMQKEALTRAVYLDSDVLTFADLNEEGRRFADCDLTLSRGHCGHNMYVNSLDALCAFCEYCAKFLSQEKANQIRSVLCDVTLQSLGVREEIFPLNDMRVLKHFADTYDVAIGNTALVHDGVAFDHDLAVAQGGFVMEQGVKKLLWRSHQPYGVFARTGREVRFATLHFKGGLKPLLERVWEEHGGQRRE